MNIATLKKELNEYKFNPAKSSSWVWLMETTIALDKMYGPPKGWHWFAVFRYLQKQEKISKFSTKKINKTIPDNHWLKTKNTISGDNALMKEWATKIQVSKKITKINFSKPFNKAIDFSNFIFPIDVSFENATFFGKADFSDTLFLKDACFNDAKFLNDIHFDDAIFIETADFKNVVFCGNTARFRDTAFEKIANFTDSRFKGYANFKGSKFKGRTSFQRAEFKFHAPRFYGATFNKEITFSGMITPKFEISIDDRLDERGKPLSLKKADRKYSKRIGENQNSYENTAILLENEKKYYDQHLFFRAEMRCRRRLEHPIIGLFYWLYEWLANYGYGIGHAFGWWLGNMCFWAIMLYFFVFQGKTEPYDRLSCSALTSLSNAHSFFLSKNERLSNCYDIKNLPLYFDLIWAVETIFGAMFLFLVLLTLRVRFRIK